jgi:metal-sulfur cluster biosynthetic enzyme
MNNFFIMDNIIIISDDKALEELVIAQIKKVYDPEIPIDVLELGLIYQIEVMCNDVYVIMTLTNPGCPSGASIMDSIKRAISMLEDVNQVDVELTFSPPYSVDIMSEAGKLELGLL